jgi:hypothetical protein
VQLVYRDAVDADCRVSTLHVSVSVCGVAIGPNRTALSGYDAIADDRFIASYSAGVCSYGVAVNADGSAA